ncbi:MAG: chemotaxis protein CheA [Myxococcales bacterium FL481]|nr:MAG: chemotaxis protein CheA [Myxococcales bacterium FL481]
MADPRAEAYETGPLLSRLNQLQARGSDAPETRGALDWLDPAMAGVLTEYEEHRLRENVRRGRGIYRVRAKFELSVIDVGIEALKDKLSACGEVITYLPSVDAAADDRIEMDILVGADVDLDALAADLADQDVEVALLREPGSPPSDAPTEAADGSTVTSAAQGTADPALTETAHSAPTPPDPNSSGTPGSAANHGPAVPGGESAPVAAGERSDEDDGAAAHAQPDVSLRSLSQTVRVDLRRLDVLMNLVGELALVEANLHTVLDRLRARDQARGIAREFKDQLRTMSRKLTLLQQGILEVRMVPLGQVFDKLARIVRKIGRESGKDVRLAISGAETELDKRIVEELSDPLMHMVRNAIDHGIEAPEDRLAAGKPARGTIELLAYQKGNRVIIEIEDDGRGIEWQHIRDTSVRKGLLTEDEAVELTPEQAINLIFLPGFSTRDQATSVSGRGVGMDVVKTNIARLSGMIDVRSQPGRGTGFSIALPVTLAIIQALVIETAGQTFCVPLNSVLESIMVEDDDIDTVEGHAVVSLRGRTLPLIDLAALFELDRSHEREHGYIYVVVVGLAQHRVGLVVDELLGQQDVVIKPLGTVLRQIPGIAGATELDANRTVLLLDVATIVAEAISADGLSPTTRDEENVRSIA